MPSNSPLLSRILSPTLALLLAASFFFVISTSQERDQSWAVVRSIINVHIFQNMSFATVIPNETSAMLVQKGTRILKNSDNVVTAFILFIKLSVSFLSFLFSWYLFKAFLTRFITGQKQNNNNSANDQVIEADELRKLTMEKIGLSRISFSGIPFPYKSDTTNLIVTGSPGSGKTINIKEILGGIRRGQKKAIVYDLNGEFISNFYRPGKDFILNPLDKRSASWDIWQDCRRHSDILRIASAVIPDHTSNHDWSRGARIILAHLIEEMAEKEGRSADQLKNSINEIHNEKMVEILKQTELASIIAENEEAACISIRGVLIASLQPLKEMIHDKTQSFSIRQWCNNENNDSWLFISSCSEDIDAIRPRATVWLEFACCAMMSLPSDHLRRTFMVIDDLNSLNNIPSLPDFMVQSRKIGSCAILAIQSLSRLRSTFGAEAVHRMTRACESWVAMKSHDQSTPQWVSSQLGKKSVIETTEISYAGQSSTQKIHKELTTPIVEIQEINSIPEMQGYIRLSQEFPTAKFNSVAREWPVISKAFAPVESMADTKEGTEPETDQSVTGSTEYKSTEDKKTVTGNQAAAIENNSVDAMFNTIAGF